MSSHVSHHVLYRIANTPVSVHPFPHIYVRDVFPQDFYRELRAHLPPADAFRSLKSLGRVSADYPDTRLVFPLTPDNVEALIVQDYSTYALAPHTDTLKKVLSFLFYLPADDSMAHLGTSIYAPKEPGFVCTKGMHYPFERFHLVTTMPYLPNSLFAFVKTSNSFHGVEPIADSDVRRDLLLYDIKVQNPPELHQGTHTA